MNAPRIGFVVGIALLHILLASGDQCNWQYFQHYEQKGCRTIVGENSCPIRFQCEQLSDEDLRTCVHKGKIYKDGEAIKDLGPCDSCECIYEGGSAYIQCDEVDCPDWEPKNKSCYMGYRPNECCPREMCPSEKEMRKTCKYNGKYYDIGEIIITSNPCRECICTEDWTDENGPGCSDVNCITGLYAQNIRKGCLPVYFENKCCLFGTYCDHINGATAVKPADKDKENYCQYHGKYYERGSVALMETDKYQCFECKCLTPPDFTCLRKACPPPPKDDCTPTYSKGCCPNYKCP